MNDLELPPWRDFLPRNFFLRIQERPLDRLMEDRNFVRLHLEEESARLLERARGLQRSLDEPGLDSEQESQLGDALGDLAGEIVEFAEGSPRRIEWALFLAGHSAYEVELVELAYGDPAVRKYAPQAIGALREVLASLIRDVDDLQDETKRLKALRDELAHAGSRFRPESPHRWAIESYVRERVLLVDERDGVEVLMFSDIGFTRLAETMNQIVRVCRAAVQ